MKRAGIVGGLGPESTVDYYQLFIQKYQERMNSTQTLPELFINSINMYNIFKFISEDRLDDLVDYVAVAANILENIGAVIVVVSANTLHIIFNEVRKKVNVPMISIVDATFEKAKEVDFQDVDVLETKFIVEQ